MHILRWNTILFVLGSLFWYVAGGLLLYALFGPVKVEPAEDETQIRRVAATDSDGNNGELPPIAAFAAVWHTPLQRPVFDAPPPATPPEVKPEPPRLKTRLMATTVSRGQPTAMFKLPSGKYVTLKVGETFENDPGTAKIVAINGKEVTLQFEGFEETTTLNVR
jgi:hypothetical protein